MSPRLRRPGAGCRDFSRDHQLQLVSGVDDFCSAWGDAPALIFPDRRAAWPGEDVLADMAEAWERHGDELCAEFESWRPLFGELVFDQGVSPCEAIEIHRKAWVKATGAATE